MARIARDAGVSTASIHYHFTSKRRLYEVVLERVAVTLRAETARISCEVCSNRTAIELIAEIGARHPAGVRLLVHDLLLAGKPRGARLSLRQALHEGAAALYCSPTHQSGYATERAGIIQEGIVAGALLAGAVSATNGRFNSLRPRDENPVLRHRRPEGSLEAEST